MTLLLYPLLFSPKIFFGFIIIHWLWKESDWVAILLKLAIGVPLGLAVSASIFFMALSIGISPKLYSQVEFWSFLLLGIIWLAKHRTLLIIEPGKSIKLFLPDILSLFIVLIGAVLSISAFVWFARMHPYGFEDARTIWNLTARFIYRSNSPDVLFKGQFYNRFHPDYPVELSLNVAWGWLFLRSETTHLPIALSLLLVYTPAIILWSALRKWSGRVPAFVGTLIFLMCVDFRYAIAQNADTLFALNMLAAVVLFYGYLRNYEIGLLVLVGFMIGFSAWIKNEGFLFVAVFSAVLMVAVWKQVIHLHSLKWFAVGVIFPLLIVLFYKVMVNWQNDLFSGSNSYRGQLLDPKRWQIIASSFVGHMIGYGRWPISALFILVIYALLIGIVKEELLQQWWLPLLIFGQLAGYFCIYLVTPHDLQLHIKTSIDRLISHVYPVMIFWLIAITRSPDLSSSFMISAKMMPPSPE